jgi:prolipoprotein diacylglyceryltransferase
MELPEKPKERNLYTVLITTAIICLFLGGKLGYTIISNQIGDAQNRLSNIEKTGNDGTLTYNIDSA